MSKNKKALQKMFEDELNKSLHHEIQTNFKWHGESREQEIRESNAEKLDKFNKLLETL